MTAEQQKHARVYRAVRAAAGPILCRIFHFSTEQYRLPGGPCLVVSNHTSDFDPIFLGRAFKDHMYFVASEHVFRWGIWSKLLTAVFHPISRLKGGADSSAALAIVRRLRAGANVLLFAEGGRSFSGVTDPIFPSTAKLVKTAKVSLVTYRIKGGYLATPRWAKKRRIGPVEGQMINVYSPEQLASMTADEINDAIQRDLHEDAFERQETERRKYRGKALAENLEYALYICPMCGRIGTLKSSGDRFFCDCGLDAVYTEEGFFEGNVPFSCVRDWDRWQQFEIKRRANFTGKEPIFSDEHMRLMQVLPDHTAQTAAEGALSISRLELRCGDFAIPLSEIQNMDLCGRTRIVFSTAGGLHYELRSDPPCCGRKYVMFFKKVKR